VVIVGAVSLIIVLRSNDLTSEDNAALLIQQTAFREATAQDDSDMTSLRGMTTGEYQRLCAVNCLYFLNRLHGIRGTYDDVKTALQPGDVGVSMAHLAEVIEAYGYSVTPRKLTPREMFEISDVMIVLSSPAKGPHAVGHYGIVVPVRSKQGYWVFDPPRNKLWVTKEQMEKMEDDQRMPVLCLKPPRPS
jgi:ABC-type bacteriocin/lantibiotic exporter with double-glycine peptidase domain